jgi:hypothetical protein
MSESDGSEKTVQSIPIVVEDTFTLKVAYTGTLNYMISSDFAGYGFTVSKV